jgi:signal transduction histidine kinase
MLRKLGRHLSLINVAISGAILIIMALASLGITEKMLTAQYENDLQSYASNMMDVQQKIGLAGTQVSIVSDKYSAYLEENGKQAESLTTKSTDYEAIKGIVDQVRADINAKINDAKNDKNSRLIDKFFSFRSEKENGANTAGLASPQLVINGGKAINANSRGNFYYAKIGNVPYRIAASVISSIVGSVDGPEETGSILLVMQDRTEELNSRDRLRWLFALCVAGGLFLIVLGSQFLSSRAIKPVEQSIRQQQAFVAAASHELRTPVAALRANAEVLQDAPLGDFKPYLGSILDESERMSRLVADLMHLARADAGELPVGHSPTDASEAADDAVQIISPLAQKNSLNLNKEISPAWITGDPDRLRQILIALLDNAVRYTPEGGEITVSVAKSGHHVDISVADTGIGIDDKHKEHIFDRFYRVDSARSRAYGGSGLGLSIAKQLVEKMHGSIRVSDREGGGSVFTITFPAAEKM